MAWHASRSRLASAPPRIATIIDFGRVQPLIFHRDSSHASLTARSGIVPCTSCAYSLLVSSGYLSPCLSSLVRAAAVSSKDSCPASSVSTSTSTSPTSRALTKFVEPARRGRVPSLTPAQRKDELEYWLTEHLRLSGLYWGLTALHLLGQPDALPRSEVLDFVISCLQGDGGFAAAPQHDSHMLYTVSGVQILAMLDALDEFDERVSGGREKVARCGCSRLGQFCSMTNASISYRQPAASEDWYFRRRYMGRDRHPLPVRCSKRSVPPRNDQPCGRRQSSGARSSLREL